MRLPAWDDWAARLGSQASGCGCGYGCGCASPLDMGLEVCLDFPFLLCAASAPRFPLATFPQASAYNLHIICVHFILFPQLRSTIFTRGF